MAQKGRVEGLDGTEGSNNREGRGAGLGFYNQVFAQLWDSAGPPVNSLCAASLFQSASEEPQVPGVAKRNED